MLDQIKEFNKQFEYQPVVENGPAKKADFTIVCGMGGSRLAGDILKSCCPDANMVVHSDYGLPCVSDNILNRSLFVANSYSGNTEEAVDFLEKALEKKFNAAVVTTGGRLLEMAKNKNISFIQMPDWKLQPRMALGLNVVALLKLMGEDDLLDEASKLVNLLKPLDYEDEGRILSEKLKGHIPIVYASTFNQVIASSWKVIFNETGKTPSFYNVFPELNHNEMIGFDKKMYGDGLINQMHFIFLKDADDHPRIVKRMEVLEKLLQERSLPVEVVDVEGESRIHKIFSSLILAEWTAYQMAKSRGVDPEQVPLVEEFKKLI